MKKVLSLFLVTLMTSQVFAQAIPNNDVSNTPVIHTLSGDLQGKNNGEVWIFKGIPYAAPPIGAFRWRPPQPLAAWKGIKEVHKYGADCAQMGFPRGADSISKTSSEDCLYLNIWMPAGTKTNSKLPVMVWIHGGAFMFGSGAQQDFSGEHFAKQGIILVTINYRLGRLGFFAFPALSKEHPEEPKGNYAYMDQIAALQWVQKNIGSFGGNPKNVTIFGESAGGVSVHSLLSIPKANGLFHKAISESGGGRNGVLTGRPIQLENADKYYPVSAETIGINFAKRYGIEGSDANALAKLRALTVAQIVDGGQETDGQGGPITYPGPILDGKLVVETAQSAYEAGRIPNVTLMIGSNSAEVPAGFVNARSKDELFSLFGNMKSDAAAVYDPEGKEDFAKILCLVNTDKVWAEPARFTANAFTKKGKSAYLYLFSYVPASMQQMMRFGASHASEIGYVFNNLRGRNGVVLADKDLAVAKMMNTYWGNFAKTGNPNGNGLTEWPVFDNKKNSLIEFQSDGKAVGKPDFRNARLDLIQKALNTGNLH